MDTNMWMEKAKAAITELPDLGVFVVRSLFQGCEWEALSRGERSAFGKFFKSEVIEGRVENVKYLEKAENNHAKYQKQGGNKK